MDLRSLAKSILSGGLKAADILTQNSPIRTAPKYYDPNTSEEERLKMLSKQVAGLTGGVVGSRNLLTSLPRSPKSVSNMVPTVVDIYDKAGKLIKTTDPYSSTRQAINMAQNRLVLPEGGRAFPRAVGRTKLSILQKRLADLTKHGADTTNVLKAIAKEMKI